MPGPKLIIAMLLTFLASCFAGTDSPAEEVRTENAMVIDGVIQGNNLAPLRSSLLKKVKGDEVDLVINSPGGSVSTGFDFVSVMESAKSKGVIINCFVAQMAASMAFQILLHCNTRHVLDRSMLLWHRARVMLGGGLGGGGVMTAPQLEVLGRSLASMDDLIFAECTRYIYMEESLLRYHFESETFHIGQQLAESTGSFISHSAIPGLYEALENLSLPRTIARSSMFDEVPTGILKHSTTTPGPWRTDLDGFEPGEIIYIK